MNFTSAFMVEVKCVEIRRDEGIVSFFCAKIKKNKNFKDKNAKS